MFWCLFNSVQFSLFHFHELLMKIWIFCDLVNFILYGNGGFLSVSLSYLFFWLFDFIPELVFQSQCETFRNHTDKTKQFWRAKKSRSLNSLAISFCLISRLIIICGSHNWYFFLHSEFLTVIYNNYRGSRWILHHFCILLLSLTFSIYLYLSVCTFFFGKIDRYTSECFCVFWLIV